MNRTPVGSSGGLSLPTALGISTTDLENILAKYNTSTSVERDLKKMGIEESPKPEFGIPDVSPQELFTTGLDHYTVNAQLYAWYKYLSPVLAKVKSGLLQARNQKTLIEAKIKKVARDQNRGRPKEERLKEEDITIEVLNDLIYQEALLEEQRLEQYKMNLDVAVDVVERGLKLFSRQIDVRGGVQGQQVGHGAGYHPPPQPIGGMRR